MTQRKLGRFFVTQAHIQDEFGSLVYAGVTPLEVRYCFDTDGWECLGIHEDFVSVKPGQEASRYDLSFEYEPTYNAVGRRCGSKPVLRRFVRAGGKEHR